MIMSKPGRCTSSAKRRRKPCRPSDSASSTPSYAATYRSATDSRCCSACHRDSRRKNTSVIATAWQVTGAHGTGGSGAGRSGRSSLAPSPRVYPVRRAAHTGRIMDEQQIVTLHGERALIDRAGHLFAGARDEFLVAAADPGTWSNGVRTAFAAGLRPATEPGGVALRKLYTPQALPDARA